MIETKTFYDCICDSCLARASETSWNYSWFDTPQQACDALADCTDKCTRRIEDMEGFRPICDKCGYIEDFGGEYSHMGPDVDCMWETVEGWNIIGEKHFCEICSPSDEIE